MTEAELARLHATVEGHVQGVGFRYFVVETANRLGLTGWVRNRWNGDVEVVAEGPRSALDKLYAALESGPRAALVMGVKPQWQKASGDYTRFQVISTG